MPITTEEITQMLENHRTELLEHMVQETKREITHKLNWELSSQISKIVTDFVKEELAADIRSQLVESKPAVLKAAVEFAEELSKDLAAAMLERARGNLKESYKRSAILKELVG